MKWHDCKTDPPKKEGRYVLIFKYSPQNKLYWDSAYYDASANAWEEDTRFGIIYRGKFKPIKWAEVNLDEDD